MEAKERVVVFGGTRGIGREVARLYAQRGASVALFGRNVSDLERSAADLRARGVPEATMTTMPCDLADPKSFAPALDLAISTLGKLDIIVVTAAVFGTQDALESDSAATARLLALDFANTILFCEEARKRLLKAGGGKLCVFSSVAGDRARSSVVLYGAAKAGLSAYLAGLDARYRRSGLMTICVKPGFVRTGMTDGLREPPFAGEAEEVAQIAVNAIDHNLPVVYAPPMWRSVMAVVRALPRFVIRRMNF